MSSPRDPQYGVQMDLGQISSQDFTSVLWGVNPQNKFIPIQVDSQGRLQMGGTITATIGTVSIEGQDYSDNTYHVAGVTNLGGIAGYAIKTVLSSGSNNLVINPDGSINVNTSGVDGVKTNLYGTQLTAPGIETTLISYVVPVGKTFSVTDMIGWGQYDGEFLIKVDGTEVGGGRTSPSFRTLSLSYLNAPITVNAGSGVTVTITQYSTSAETMKANLLGTLS